MLKDSLVEQSVKSSPGGAFYAKIVISIWITIVMIPLTFFVGAVALIPFAIGCFVSGHFWSERNIEYEYSFVNEIVDFAAIYNLQRRKELMHFEFSQVKMIAKKDDQRLEHEASKCSKIRDFSAKKSDEPVYAMIVEQGDHTELVYITPNEKAIEHFKLYAKDQFTE